MATTTIQVHDMTYHVHRGPDGLYDVTDAGGSRPLGLRSEGPWETPEEAAEAVRGMTPEQARE